MISCAMEIDLIESNPEESGNEASKQTLVVAYRLGCLTRLRLPEDWLVHAVTSCQTGVDPTSVSY